MVLVDPHAIEKAVKSVKASRNIVLAPKWLASFA
jgi:hypothetical protein